MNETLNGTLNVSNITAKAIGTGVDVAQSFLPLVLHRMWELVAAPFRHPEMLWILFPLFLTLIVLEFYFDRHGDDELGWAAAVAVANTGTGDRVMTSYCSFSSPSPASRTSSTPHPE